MITQVTNLLLIDPQVDFHDKEIENYMPKLPVSGSSSDAETLVKFMESKALELSNIFVSLDTHEINDISHPDYWVDSEGSTVQPFTEITHSELLSGKYSTKNPKLYQHALDYTRKLELSGEKHFVFPHHCVLGTKGHDIYPIIKQQINRWEDKSNRKASIFTKGENPNYEFFGAFRSEVVDNNVSDTMMNNDLIGKIIDCDILYVSGQALSHCVSKSLFQIIDYIEDKYKDDAKAKIGCINLIVNTTSPVTGFEDQANSYLEALKSKGVVLVTA